MKPTKWLVPLFLTAALLLSSCSTLTAGNGASSSIMQKTAPAAVSEEAQLVSTPVVTQPQPQINVDENGTIAAYQGTLEEIYQQVGPSVVSIAVKSRSKTSVLNLPEIPGFNFQFGDPNQNQEQAPLQQGLGSGFVWDQEGRIVTNNHVVEGAEDIQVRFYDGTTLSGEIVGTDPDSDLAVVKIDSQGLSLQPLSLGDSDQIKVGQLAIAIGSPFGLENTMTVGIISAVGRNLPTSDDQAGASYTIPDIIQTDAPINPGNSGGVLLDSAGQVIGVTTAIQSPVQANIGIGFAVPANIVNKVVPALINDGVFEHPWIGISGTTLTPDVAEAMKADRNQKGALVIDVVPGSPAEAANLRGSDKTTTKDGQDIRLGGDIITAIEQTPVQNFDDIVVYLANHAQVGQDVNLSVLRNGKPEKVNLTLAARPVSQTAAEAGNEKPAAAWLGISGIDITPAIAEAAGLEKDQTGVLIERVSQNGPADAAGLQGSFKPVTVDGQEILTGGDIITAVDGKNISTMQELKTILGNHQPEDTVQLQLLRAGKTISLDVTLGTTPQ